LDFIHIQTHPAACLKNPSNEKKSKYNVAARHVKKKICKFANLWFFSIIFSKINRLFTFRDAKIGKIEEFSFCFSIFLQNRTNLYRKLVTKKSIYNLIYYTKWCVKIFLPVKMEKAQKKYIIFPEIIKLF
jgi:hypothetical protein